MQDLVQSLGIGSEILNPNPETVEVSLLGFVRDFACATCSGCQIHPLKRIAYYNYNIL